MTRFVGIDLGTSNVTVAVARGDAVEVVSLPQLVGPELTDRRPLLPSVLYAPERGECAAPRLVSGWVAGEFARARAAETTGAAIVSSKSWLSYAAVDRSAAILPWRADTAEGTARISPFDAARILLEHVRRGWDECYPNEPLGEQRVVLTVPASFDAAARELTIRAARAVGLSPVLLEEPQAAFLDWASAASINDSAESHRGGGLEAAIPKGASEGTVLVVDVGGGTTDLSLIRVSREAQGFALSRVAVGRHLLLGGDNMDLTLAHLCEARMMGEERLAAPRFAELAVACRHAKERIFAPDAPEAVTVVLRGGGSKLLGGARTTTLERAEVTALLVDGFFPHVPKDAEPIRTRAAVVAFGLPFERDVAITRHVAAFCAKYGQPTALLVNGGVFHARAFAERLQAVVASFSEAPLVRLPAARPEFAVACGAVRYALALAGRGLRIRAGSTRSFYVGITNKKGQRETVCVLPLGAEDGTLHRAPQTFALVLGETVQFELWSREALDSVGAVSTEDESYEPLPPLVAVLDGAGTVEVTLEAQLSAVGTLELACLAADGRSFALSFELRSAGRVPGLDGASLTSRRAPIRGAAPKSMELATAVLDKVFGKAASATEREVKDLLRELERCCGKRESWDGEVCRSLFDRLMVFHKGRRQSKTHERVFWQVAGYTLRPGAGAARDPERAALLFRLFDVRLAHPETRSWQQFWIAWRRVAAGLDETAQARVRDVLDPELAPTELRLKRDKGFRNDAAAEMLELAASLERVPSLRRAELGSWTVERTWTERDPRLWAALGRTGGRIPVYGSVHQVVRAETVSRWVDHLVREKWDAVPTAPAAAIAMCRLTGDRERDVADRTRELVDKKLAALDLDEAFRAPLHDVVALRSADHSAFFGDDLPSGLRLVPTD